MNEAPRIDKSDDYLIVFVFALASALVILVFALFGLGPYSLTLTLAFVTASIPIALIGFYRIGIPSLAVRDGEFILLRRKVFGDWRPQESFNRQSISRILFLQIGRGKPHLRVELTDGRHFAFLPGSLDTATYDTLATLGEKSGENFSGTCLPSSHSYPALAL